MLTDEEKKWSWAARSDDGSAVVTQARKGGVCTVEGPGWKSSECLGDAMQLHFVSADGKKVLEIDTLPEQGTDWHTAEVVRLYSEGKLIHRTNAGALAPKESALKKFQVRFAWVEGSAGLPGPRPTHAGPDAVELTPVGGKKMKLGFDGSGIPPPLAAKTGTEPASCDGLMQWTDAEGETHFTDSIRNVPAGHRSKIKCMAGGQLTVVGAAPLPKGRPGGLPGDYGSAGFPAPGPAPEPRNVKQVYCAFSILQKAKSTKNITVIGGDRLKHSYCVTATLAEAIADCDRQRKQWSGETAACQCTDDATFIGDRCSPQ